MRPRASSDLLRSTRDLLWTVDTGSGEILDWNIAASDLCGWHTGATTHAFRELAQLLKVDTRRKPSRLTLAEIAGLAGAAGRGRRIAPLQARLRRPGSSRTHYLDLEALSLGFRRRSNVVLLVATPSHDSAAEYQSANPLAAVVGHELNNISVPLCGFTELAAGSTTLDESVRLCLDELRIAIARIKSIASDLESLAESESRAARPTIGKCLAAPGGDRASEPWNIDWLCPTNTVIAVDLLQAQRALEALARIAARAGPAIRAAVFLLPTDPSCNTRCVVCDATFARENGFVVIQAYGIRAIGVEVLIEPFVSERGGGGARRLNLAVLVHCAHAAGGHLLLDGSADSISVAFPQG